MPYASVAELPPEVKGKLKSPKKRRQWLHVWNSSYKEHHDESRAFASAWSAVRKMATGITEMDDKLNFFLPIAKIDKDARTISGYASTACLDSDGEIVAQDALKAALPDYMQWRNIREMHKPSAVGVAQEANLDHRGLYLTAKIVDEGAWNKVLEGVYKGFSIGGRKLAKVGNTITKIGLSEISVVDRPANPECHFTVNKMAGDDGADAYLVPESELVKSEQGAQGASKGDKANLQAQAQAKAARKAKKAKKLAKKLASKSSSQIHGANGGAEAASGKVESRHELDLEKTEKTGFPPSPDSLSLLEEGIGKIDKFRRRGNSSLVKGRTMSEEGNNSALNKALIQLLAGRLAPNPTLGLLKAAEGDMKEIKSYRKGAEECVKTLFDMHKNALNKSAGGSFDHDAAVKVVQKLYAELASLKQVAKSAKGNLEKAAGRVSAPGTVEDPLAGVYTPDPGGQLQLVSPSEMDSLPAHKGGGSAVDLKKYVSTDQVDAMVAMAKLQAENELLKSMPAAPSGGRRPQAFDMSKLGGGTVEADSNLLKGINPADFQSHDDSTRETAVAKMIGNSLIHGRGQTVLDPNFHGTAGFGKPN
jgi:hypothetical protein